MERQQNVQIDSDWGMRDWTYALRAVNAIINDEH